MKRERKGCDSLGGGWKRGCRERLCKVAWELLIAGLIIQQLRGCLKAADDGSVKSHVLESPHAGANRGAMQGGAGRLCDI